jgi:hypothetical protein
MHISDSLMPSPPEPANRPLPTLWKTSALCIAILAPPPPPLTLVTRLTQCLWSKSQPWRRWSPCPRYEDRGKVLSKEKHKGRVEVVTPMQEITCITQILANKWTAGPAAWYRGTVVKMWANSVADDLPGSGQDDQKLSSACFTPKIIPAKMVKNCRLRRGMRSGAMPTPLSTCVCSSYIC